MAKLLNLDAATGADIQYASATDPTITLSNASGAALKLNKVDVQPIISAANATIGPIHIAGSSAASAPLISFTGIKTLASCSTIAFTTGGAAGTYAIRVALPSGLFGWIPIMPDAAVTAEVV